MAPPHLLGPPDIHKRPPSPSSDPFTDLITECFNGPPLRKIPPTRMIRTENNSATYLSSGNPCLDFFFQVVPDTPLHTLTGLLKSAWAHDPLKALKLVCHLRGVRGTGKSDKEGFYTAALWLHGHHPKTLSLNIGPITGFGYFKDLPEILNRILNGADVREIQRRQNPHRGRRSICKISRRFRKRRRLEDWVEEEDKAETVVTLKEKKASATKRATERYARDPDYRFLYNLVCDFFAASLVADIERLKSGKLCEIGLAAKWCPSLDSFYDRSTLLCEGIATRVFPRESAPDSF